MLNTRLQVIDSYILAHYSDPELSVARLAEIAEISQTRLREIVFLERHTHPGDLLESHRLAIACNLLKSSKLPIQEISLQVGYVSTKTFREAFRRRIGQNPIKYRSNQKKQKPPVKVRPKISARI